MKKNKKKVFIIKTPGPILYGSISTAKSTCGNPTCKCHSHKKHHHGPYYRWTGIIHGKRTTVTLNKITSDECIRRIKNYEVFQKQINMMLDVAIDSAPWNTD